MKQMTLKDIQNVSIEIVQDIHDFCQENNIRYSLDGGSLLGAIRHKGFIPWDDDMDILMPRPDYEKFIKLYRNRNGYELRCFETGTSYLSFGRVCEVKRTYAKPNVPWTNIETGIFVDVFPADGLTSDWNTNKKIIEKANYLMHWTNKKRFNYVSLSKKHSISWNINVMLHKLLAVVYLRNPTKAHIKLAKEIDFATSQYWGQISYTNKLHDEKARMNPIDMWDNIITVPFENTKFNVFADYDRYLKRLYGNYMQLPPVEKRRNSGSCENHFWK